VKTYDLEILSDDWTRYDANSAIVRTSALSAADIERFVGAFEGEIQQAWEVMVKAYRQGTNPPEIDLQVEGHFRMKLVYRLLSEDLIERAGAFAREEIAESGDGADLEALCQKIEAATDEDGALIRKTLKSFAATGYITKQTAGDRLQWHWTHNRGVKRLFLN
jgi:hypothetical protein